MQTDNINLSRLLLAQKPPPTLPLPLIANVRQTGEE